ncbi:MAG: DUF5011 domain-containing protein, partial [Bacilli bacterium]|nr:DUF5011 domain-containing protein [Bacilli bacterium]
MKKKVFLIIGLIIVLLIGIIFSIYEFILLPNISLKGKNPTIVKYESKYVEKGFKATSLGKDISKDVKVSGKVNGMKLGEYKITYKVGKGIFTRKVIRKVLVKDLEKPKMDIKDNDVYVCPGSDFVPEKVTATDNYDKKLKVKNVLSRDKSSVTYSVTDSSGNTTSITKKVLYKDVEAPKIEVIGGEEMYIQLGAIYDDPGVKVIDNCDGEIKDVKRDGSWDANKLGDYTLTYTVTDKAGNKATATRKVIVSNGIIYLTFDDGPNSGTTNVILDILKEEGVKATFFVTNKGPDELIKREYDEGHTVALHTASHDYAIVYASDESYFNDLNIVSERVKRITGEESKIIRFPGGASNTISRRYSNGIMSRLTQE